MKAEELMVGDWVYFTYPTYPIPAIVKAISPREGSVEGYTFLLRYDGNEACPVRQGMVKPIPITPEILEKNGFKKCDEDTDGAILYEIGDQILGADVWVNTEPCLFNAWRTWAGNTLSYTVIEELPISFVHELQHALRLCGIEKEIGL